MVSPSHEGGDWWGSIHISIDFNLMEFLENSSQDANMRGFWLLKAPLQVADTEYVGWLLFTHGSNAS